MLLGCLVTQEWKVVDGENRKEEIYVSEREQENVWEEKI